MRNIVAQCRHECKSLRSSIETQTIRSYAIGKLTMKPKNNSQQQQYIMATTYASMQKGTSSTYMYKGTEDVPKNVTHVTIHRSISTIERYSFQKCSHLKTVIMKEDIKNTQSHLLDDARNETSQGKSSTLRRNFHKTLITIDRCAFGHCTSLISINLPHGLTYIRQNAFRDCTSLTNVYFPDTVKEIGSTAFRCCKSIVKLDLPPSLVKIGFAAFYCCENLISISIPLKSEEGYNVLDMPSIRTSEDGPTPFSLLKIYPAAFRGCEKLINIALPSSIHIKFMDKSDEFNQTEYPSFSKCTFLHKVLNVPEQESPNKGSSSDDDERAKSNIHTLLQKRFDNLPLHSLCYQYRSNYPLTSKKEIQNSISSNKRNATINAVDCLGFTALHLLVCCWNTVDNDSSINDIMHLIAKMNPSLLSVKACNGMTPLQLFYKCNELSRCVPSDTDNVSQEKKENDPKQLNCSESLSPRRIRLSTGLYTLGLSNTNTIQGESKKKNEKTVVHRESSSSTRRIRLMDALEHGLAWNMIESLLILDPQAFLELGQEDMVTNLLPFLQAISSKNSNLDVAYNLMRLSVPSMIALLALN